MVPVVVVLAVVAVVGCFSCLVVRLLAGLVGWLCVGCLAGWLASCLFFMTCQPQHLVCCSFSRFLLCFCLRGGYHTSADSSLFFQSCWVSSSASERFFLCRQVGSHCMPEGYYRVLAKP